MGDMNLIGASVKRKEDYRFLTGAGQYTDDIVLPLQNYACFVRSPHAHAEIKAVNKDAALEAPGVVAVFTGEDTGAIRGLPCGWLITSMHGEPKAVDKVIDKGKKIAAHLLEAAEADIEFENGHFQVAGTDKKKAFAEIALVAYVPHNYPLDKLEPGLNESAFYDPANFTYPAGSYVCEVEVDPDTGITTVVSFVAVDDFGNVVNPMIVEGQVHGGLAQGIGQALLEGCRYDAESGQLLTGTYQDYCMPRADDVPSFRIGTEVTPCTHNPLGVKGCGEAGAIGAPPAVINAITDAIGVRDVPMPATPETVWRALHAKA
jgi:carbon-monoxide dehydrogenase large subunit